MIHRLTGALEFQAQALSLRAERQRHLASNIANADTPGYVARDFDFANALREATAGLGGPRNAPGAAPSNELGAPVAGNLLREPGQRYEPRVAYATPSQTNLDANTVDMDRERASFADNAVKYEATLRFINGSVRTMLDAMKGHHQ
ncbi:MAG: flagellar basal body rod protein FlgB [Rubrivivax sp.]|jgi:flagellar basal-body rod protein FlgB